MNLTSMTTPMTLTCLECERETQGDAREDTHYVAT